MSYICFECGENIFEIYEQLNENFKSKITDKFYVDQKPLKDNKLYESLDTCCKKRIIVFTLPNEPN